MEPVDTEFLESEWGKDQSKNLQAFFKLLLELAAARSWSQIHYVMCVPNVLVRVHDEVTENRERGMAWMRKIWQAVCRAELMVYGDGEECPSPEVSFA